MPADSSAKRRGLVPSVRAAIAAALAEIAPIWSQQSPEDVRRVVEFHRGHFLPVRIERYRGVRSGSRFRSTVKSLESVRNLEAVIRRDQPELLAYISYAGRSRLAADMDNLITLWVELIEQRSARDGSIAAAVNTLIDELDNLLTTGDVTYQIVAPVSGLQLPDDVNEIEFSGEVVIRRLSEDEVLEIGSNDIESTPLLQVEMLGITAAIVVRRTTKVCFSEREPTNREISYFHEEIYELLRTMVHGCHILKPGRAVVVAHYPKLLPYVLPSMHEGAGTPGTTQFGAMRIDSREIAALVSIFKKLTMSEREEVRIAAARLADSESRSNAVDGFLDAFSGLEYLLRPHGLYETSFRVALNYACLGPTDLRRERYEQVRKIQQTRSALVHGGLNVRSKGAAEVDEHWQLARQCLRDALNRFINDADLQGNKKLDADFWLDRVIPATK
jgi:hypothetical protein